MTRQWILDHHPQPDEKPSQFFKLTETALYNSNLSPATGPGGLADKKAVIVKPLFLSNDPSQRTWIGEKGSYITIKVGDLMKSWGVGKVVESHKEGFKKGDLVWGMLAWSEYMLFEDPETHYPPGLTKLTEAQASDPASYIAARLTVWTLFHQMIPASSRHPPPPVPP